MKTYYAVRTLKGKLKLQELPGDHLYTIHSTTYKGAQKCLKMLQDAEDRLNSENE